MVVDVLAHVAEEALEHKAVALLESGKRLRREVDEGDLVLVGELQKAKSGVLVLLVG